MKRKVFYAVLAAEAILLGAWALTADGSAAPLLFFPWAPLGHLLRGLSLSGTAGNLVAWGVMMGLGLLPCFYGCVRFARRALQGEDALLPFLSVFVIMTLYACINPTVMAEVLNQPLGGTAACGALAITCDTVMVAYIVARALRCRDAHTVLLLQGALAVLAMVLVYGVAGQGVLACRTALAELAEANTAPVDLTASRVVILLQSLVDALPYLAELIILHRLSHLASGFEAERFEPVYADRLQKLALLCRGAILAMVFVELAMDLLQLMLGDAVMQSQYTLHLPLAFIVIDLILWLLARHFAEAAKAKQENDLFV